MILILLLCALFHSGLEASRSAFVYTIPGINGLGSEANYVRTLLGDDSIAVVPVETPRTLPDLGQSRCINYLEAALTKDALKDPSDHSCNITRNGNGFKLFCRGR